MILIILKWVGIIILSIWFLGILKNIFLNLLYRHNKEYKNAVDIEQAKQMIQEVAERRQLEEQQKQDRLGMLIHQWTQTAQYYYYYYEKGTMLIDYSYMLDLLTQQIIALLGGDYKVFRNEIATVLKDKQTKILSDKGITPLPKDLKPRDFENRNFTNDDIDKILDEYLHKIKEQKEKEDKSNDKPKEDK